MLRRTAALADDFPTECPHGKTERTRKSVWHQSECLAPIRVSDTNPSV
ncbi:MAG: hypothetical protein LBG87_01865 [Spirochaetaceae bacterium]|nr:hypothetical protein [Spirochaetaceae bacterium]